MLSLALRRAATYWVEPSSESAPLMPGMPCTLPKTAYLSNTSCSVKLRATTSASPESPALSHHSAVVVIRCPAEARKPSGAHCM